MRPSDPAPESGDARADGIVERTAHALRRTGLYVSRARRTIWIHGGSIEDFEHAAGLLAELKRRFRSNHLLLSSARADACRRLRERERAQKVVPPPWGSRRLAERFLDELGPVILIWLEADEGLPLVAACAARARGIPVIVLASRLARTDLAALASLVDVFVVADAATAERLSAAGAADVRVAEALGAAEWDLPALGAIEHWLERVPTRPRGERFHRRRRMRQISESRLGRWLAERWSRRRIEGWEALRRRLGSPRTILCLGNGPTSEDPRVLDAGHDCLMRVNRRWLGRGILERPDVVFVGDLRTTLEVPACVFVFRGVAKEREVLLRHLFLGRRLAPIELFTLERERSPLADREWGAKPTNGAVMITTAVMLRPERIVIAGMDLFSHPAGAYPGDPLVANEYFRGHDRDAEVAILRHVLAGFEGELVILSPALEAALE